MKKIPWHARFFKILINCCFVFNWAAPGLFSLYSSFEYSYFNTFVRKFVVRIFYKLPNLATLEVTN